MDEHMQPANATEMSLSDATKPLLIVSKLVGLNPQSNWQKIYTVCILVYEFTMICCIWKYYSWMVTNDYFNTVVHSLEDTCHVTWLLITLGLGLFDQTRFVVPIKDFARIDQGLKTLNGFIDNRDTYRFQISLGIYVGILLLLLGLVEFVLISLPMPSYQLNVINLMAWSYNVVLITVGAVVDNCFSSTVSIIRKRFKEINLIIQRARQHGSYSTVDYLEVSRAQPGSDVLRDLRILRQQYHDLWGIAYRVNEAYSLHFLVGLITSMAIITTNLWTSYFVLASYNESRIRIVGESLSLIAFYVTRLFLLVKASEGTVAEAKATSVVLQELGIKGEYDRATRDELQLEARKFTACGFFDIDFRLIGGLLGLAFTYLVILIQLNDHTSCVITGHFNQSKYFVDEDHP